MKIKQILEGYDLFEMLNTEFDKLSDWSVIGGVDTCYGMVGDVEVRMTLAPITVRSLNGINVSFAVWDGIKHAEVSGAVDTAIAGKIIGAVTNTLKDRLQHYDWDFVVAVAKDNIQTRMKLYQRVAMRIGKEQHIAYGSRMENGVGFVVLSNNVNMQDIVNSIAL